MNSEDAFKQLTFAEHLAAAKGSVIKARRTLMKARRWRDVDWFTAWPCGLADEIEIAIRLRLAMCRTP